MAATNRPITDPEQLQDLPVGTVAIGSHGTAWVRGATAMRLWRAPDGGGYGSSYEELNEVHERMFRHEGPLTVVWLP